MNNDRELPKRKSTRLKSFDYSSVGAYFVTICIRDRMQILSEIVRTDLTFTDKAKDSVVGEGLAPPEFMVKLKPCGEILNGNFLMNKSTPTDSKSVGDYYLFTAQKLCLNKPSRAPVPTK